MQTNWFHMIQTETSAAPESAAVGQNEPGPTEENNASFPVAPPSGPSVFTW